MVERQVFKRLLFFLVVRLQLQLMLKNMMERLGQKQLTVTREGIMLEDVELQLLLYYLEVETQPGRTSLKVSMVPLGQKSQI